MDAEVVPLPPQRDWTTRYGIKFYRFKTLLKRRWWLLLLTVSIGLAFEGWLVFSKKPAFESTGMLMVTERAVMPENSQGYSEERENFYGTQIQLLQNPEVYERAKRRVALEAADLPPCRVELAPTLVPRSAIFNVAGRGENGPYTQAFVNAAMQEFINYKLEKLKSLNIHEAGEVSSELERLGNERKEREARLAAFLKENKMAFWEETGRTAAKYLSDLKTKQANLNTELQKLETLSPRELLSQQPVASASPGVDGGGSVMNDLNSQYLLKKQELIQKKAEFAERAKIWRPAHPRLIAMRQDIDSIERLLATIESQHAEESRGRISAIKAELAVLDTKIQEWEEKSNAASEKDAEYQRLKESLTRTNGLYEKLAGNLNGLQEVTRSSQGTVQVMQTASVPAQVNPGTVKHLLTGLFLGLLAGSAILVIMDKADDRFSSSTEVMENFTETILGQIPDVDDSRTDAGLPLLRENDERYAFAESLRSLRSSLIFLPNQTALKSLIITSSIPGEGKSTLASNLAITMALSGTRVLLVDADLRRGDLAQLFDTDGRTGLSTILRDETPWKSVAQSTKYKALTLIPRGPVTNQSSELLLTPRLGELLEEWKSAFDLVLFNTSPILATDDTASIAPNFDGTLMVLRAQFTSGRLVRNSMNALYQRQVNVLGLILNCVNTDMPDYYYYRYPKYYAA